jgi:hypothetical protein
MCAMNKALTMKELLPFSCHFYFSLNGPCIFLCGNKLKYDSLKDRKLKINKWSAILQVSLNGHHVCKAIYEGVLISP